MGRSWKSTGLNEIDRPKLRGEASQDNNHFWTQLLVYMAFGLYVLMWITKGSVLTLRILFLAAGTLGIMIMIVGFVRLADVTSDRAYFDNPEARKAMFVVWGGFSLTFFGGVLPFFIVPMLLNR